MCETEIGLIEAPNIDTQPGAPIPLSFQLDKALSSICLEPFELLDG